MGIFLTGYASFFALPVIFSSIMPARLNLPHYFPFFLSLCFTSLSMFYLLFISLFHIS